MQMTRRQIVAAMAAATAAPASAMTRRPDVIVVGAGVFGAWTAEKLRRQGRRVLLTDAVAPAHARASSGGESRLTRAAYGADEVYTRMALDSLADWTALSATAGPPVFHPTGILFFFPGEQPYATASLDVHRRLGLPTERLDAEALRRRWPQVDWSGTAFGLHEPGFGALMARRAVETLVRNFVRGGGDYARVAVAAPVDLSDGLRLADGGRVDADHYVFACGPWLPQLFPDLVAPRMFVTRQAVFFFATPPGDDRFGAAALPGWADFNDGDLYYGFPDLEGRGFKIAHDAHGPIVTPETNDRRPTDAELADVRGYMARRFPAMADAPLNEVRVCQYENSASGDLLIDWHPGYTNALLVGMGSGHGFKHGPAVGARAADLVVGRGKVEPRFSLASKAMQQARAVH
jgi:glycine/D-amino acid oxidase-like deaminating enzyme